MSITDRQAAPALPAPSPLVAFCRRRLEARDEARLWFGLALLLGVIAAVVYEVSALHRPALSIQDDARMFLSWMGRWDDPSLLRGDLVAGYWEAVTPWAYKLLFHAAWAVGLKPVLFAKILPAVLLPLVPLFAYRFMRAIGAEPLVAFLTTAAILAYIVQTDFIVSGTPRAFWPILALALLDGLARGRTLQVVLAQLLMAGLYPQMAMTTATVIGLSFLRLTPRPHLGLGLDLSRRRLILVGASALVTIAATVPFLISSGAYAPSFTLAEALQIPTFGPGGRGTLISPNGGMDFVCSPRVGFFNGCEGGWGVWGSFTMVASLVGPVLMFGRALRRQPATGLASPLPFMLLLASALWFALAAAVMFRLHLPNRYTAANELLALLTTLPLLIEWARNRPFPEWLVEKRAGRITLVGGLITVLLLCAAGAANVRKTMSIANPTFIEAVRALPKEAVVGGFVQQLDYSPALTNRSTLFSRELAIAYQKGYFLPIMARMAAMKDIVLTRDPAILVARIGELGMTHLVADEGTLAAAEVPRRFRGFFDAARLAAEEKSAGPASPLVATLAPACRIGLYEGTELIDAGCLVAAARARLP